MCLCYNYLCNNPWINNIFLQLFRIKGRRKALFEIKKDLFRSFVWLVLNFQHHCAKVFMPVKVCFQKTIKLVVIWAAYQPTHSHIHIIPIIQRCQIDIIICHLTYPSFTFTLAYIAKTDGLLNRLDGETSPVSVFKTTNNLFNDSK